jgi:hypothetical protein
MRLVLGSFRASPFYTLNHGRGQLQHSNRRVALSFYMNRDAIIFRERVGNHLKLLPVKPDAAGSSVAKMFNVRTHFRNRGGFKIASSHNNVIVVFG